jgi:2-C-methyl-D-erythritol 4-phosphate cytidylyltransferase
VKRRVGVIVPAAGSGTRLRDSLRRSTESPTSGSTPRGGKAFLELAGEPMLLHSLRPFLAEPRVVCVAVAVPPDVAASPPAWLTGLGERVRAVPGGATRTQSVRAGLAALPSDLDAIAVHDAARPLVTSTVVSACVDLALEGRGAVAGCPVVDTLKRIDAERRVLETPDRSSMWHAQTPQAFPADVLRDAYADAGAEATDDATLVERVRPDVVVTMVDAGSTNFKVTRAEDVVLAEAILRSRAGARDP